MFAILSDVSSFEMTQCISSQTFLNLPYQIKHSEFNCSSQNSVFVVEAAYLSGLTQSKEQDLEIFMVTRHFLCITDKRNILYALMIAYKVDICSPKLGYFATIVSLLG